MCLLSALDAKKSIIPGVMQRDLIFLIENVPLSLCYIEILFWNTGKQ